MATKAVTLEYELLRVWNMKEGPDRASENPRWGVLNVLPWMLDECTVAWPAGGGAWGNPFIIQTMPEGPELARIDAGRGQIFEDGAHDQGWITWESIREKVAGYAAKVKEGTGDGETQAKQVALSIEGQLVRIPKMMGISQNVPKGKTTSHGSAGRIRRRSAKRLHLVRERLVESMPEGQRREDLKQAFQIIDRHQESFDIKAARDVLRAGDGGMRIRRWIERYPLGAGIALKKDYWGESLWTRSGMGEMIANGARDEAVFEPLRKELLRGKRQRRREEPELETCLGTRRMRAVLSTGTTWIRRYRNVQGRSTGRGELTEVAQHMLVSRDREITVAGERMAMDDVVRIKLKGVGERDRKAIVGLVTKRAERELGGLNAKEVRRDGFNRQIASDAKRYGLPLRPTNLRTACMFQHAVGRVLNEARDLGEMLEFAWPQESAGRTWLNRLYQGDEGQAPSWKKLIELSEKWEKRVGRRVADAMNAIMNDEQRQISWISPKVPGKMGEVKVTALCRVSEIMEEGHRMDHCVDASLRVILGVQQTHNASSEFPSAVHVYRLEDEDGISSTLGIVENGPHWKVYDHEGEQRKICPQAHMEAAREIVEGLEQGRYQYDAREGAESRAIAAKGTGILAMRGVKEPWRHGEESSAMLTAARKMLLEEYPDLKTLPAMEERMGAARSIHEVLPGNLRGKERDPFVSRDFVVDMRDVNDAKREEEVREGGSKFDFARLLER